MQAAEDASVQFEYCLDAFPLDGLSDSELTRLDEHLDSISPLTNALESSTRTTRIVGSDEAAATAQRVYDAEFWMLAAQRTGLRELRFDRKVSSSAKDEIDRRKADAENAHSYLFLQAVRDEMKVG